MKILMVGRGVIAVAYGWALERAGHEIEFFVRPGRAAKYGKTVDVELLDARRRWRGRRVAEKWPVRYRESLEPDHDFDLIVVSVQHYGFAEAMSFLAPRVGKATVLVFNNLWAEPSAAVDALPADQVAWGFPGAGGGFGDDGVLRAALLPVVFFGTLGEPPTERARAVRTAFRQAGFRTRENTDFRGWLTIHFIQNAGLHTQSLKLGSLAELAGKPRNVREAILATRELLPLAEARGIDLRRHRGDLLPFTAPVWLAAPVLAWLFGHFPPMRTVMEAHANPEELRAVCRDTLAEARRLGVSAPRLEAAEPYFAFRARHGEGPSRTLSRMGDVTVLGAGAAGLAVAAQLKARGVDAVVLERGPGVATSWRGRYDRLHLHTIRSLSGLPGFAIPREYGRWVAKDDLVRYLEAYAKRFDLEVRTGTTVERIKPGADGWTLQINGGEERSTRTLIVATGYLHTPVVPQWPGQETWGGTLLHSADYRNPEPFRGKDVLVVGPGNSGSEIASDLAEGGAASVRLAIRTPPHIVRRETAGWPAQANGLLLGRLPEPALNALAATMARLEMPDLRPYGIARPSEGLKTRLRTHRYVPVQDVGIVRDVVAGRVRPVAAVRSFTADSVLLADGASLRPDVVVAATGFGTGLRELFDDPSLFDETGVPLVHGGVPARPGLFFVGYDVTLGGMLRQVAIESRRVARAYRG